MTVSATVSLEEASVRLWDAVVVGAGPAGALAARELTRRNLAVLLVDRASFPRWKVCGACLSPRALAILADIGLGSLAADHHAVPLTALHLATCRRSATLALSGSVALSRESFDATLVQAAIDAGAAFLPETYATLAGRTDRGRTVFLRQGARERMAGARIIVAADGLAGRFLAGEAGFRTVVIRNSRVGAGAIADPAPAH